MTQDTTHTRAAEDNTFIHIGLPKTATTSLQRNLFSRHPEIFQFCHSGPDLRMKWALKMIRGQDSLDYSQERVSNLVKAILLARPPEAGRFLVSDEMSTITWHPDYVCVDRTVVAQRLRDTFGNGRILFFIRDPERLLGSLYSEWMRWYGTKHFVDLAFNQWVEQLLNTRETTWLSILKYMDIFRIYTRIFGRDRVSVFKYEDLARDNQAFITSLCRFMGVEHTGAGELFAGVRHRPLLTREELARIRSSVLPPDCENPSEPIETRLTRLNRKRLVARFAQGYQELENTAGIRLDEYGLYQ